MLYVERYFAKNIPGDAIVIDTTSRSKNWSKGLSPFVLEGGNLYEAYYATNVENAWQASKVYKEFVGADGNPTKEYFLWANRIWRDPKAHRYPMGKGSIPEYSWWNGEKLDYVEARKRIYIPIYTRAVLKSCAFDHLLTMYKKEDKDIYLLDFDGYNHVKQEKSLKKVIDDPKEKMGHAFVVYGLLTKLVGKKEFNNKKLF